MRKTLALCLLLLASQLCHAQPLSNEVAGLKLPKPFEVAAGKGYIDLQAEAPNGCSWLVRCSKPIIFTPRGDVCTVSIPCEDALIEVFAVTVADGKLSPFASTTITVKGGNPGPPPGPAPTPTPTPPPTPAPYSGRILTLIVETTSARTPEIARVVTSQALRAEAGENFRVLDIADPLVTQRRLKAATAQDPPGPVDAVGTPALILMALDPQGSTVAGTVLQAVKLPATEQEAIAVIRRAKGR